jgi:ketosteroid isomerase-like protein
MGGVAVDRGRTLGPLVSRTGGATRELDDKYVMMLRLEQDGTWRIARLMWNTNEQPD